MPFRWVGASRLPASPPRMAGAGSRPGRAGVVAAALLAVLPALAAAAPHAAPPPVPPPAPPVAEGSLQDWLLLGAFQRDDAATRLAGPILPDESAAAPAPKSPAEGRTWRRHRSASGVVDLLSDAVGFTCRYNAAAYAFTYIVSPADQDAVLRLGSDDGIAAWLNGERVWFNDVYRPLVADEDAVPVRLLRGWNLLLLRVSQGVGAWGFSARLTDGSGHALPGVQVLADATEAKAPLPDVPHAVRLIGYDVAAGAAGPDGKIEYGLSLRLRNLAPVRLDGATVTLCAAPQETLRGTQPRETGACGEWAVKTIDLVLTFDDLIALSAAPRPGVSIKVGDKALYAELDGVLPRRLLDVLLGPIRIRMWRVLKKDAPGVEQAMFPDAALQSEAPGGAVVPEGPALWVRGRLEVPRPLDGAPFELVSDRARMEVYVNGAALKSSRHGVWPIATPSAREHVVAIKIDPEGTQPVRLPSVAFRWSDQAAGLDPETLGLFESLYPEARPDVLRRSAEIVAKLARGGVKPFLAELGALQDAVRGRAGELKAYTIWFVGRAQVDLAWLWRREESARILQDVFGRAVQLVGEHPRFTFAQGQAAAYDVVEKQIPDLFAKVRAAAKEKEPRWIPVGGMWVEPDLNLPSGESLVRQILHGKRYFRSALDADVVVGWNPDAFGHSAQMPQILKKSGMPYYYLVRGGGGRRLFWWEGLDGSRVLCSAVAPRPPSAEIFRRVRDAALPAKQLLEPFGAEGYGGGPTREDLERIDRLRAKPLALIAPAVDFGSPAQYFPLMDRASRERKDAPVPVVTGELQVPFAGAYTTRGEIKQANRRGESVLAAAETAAAFAHDAGLPYDRVSLDQAWRRLLFQQARHIITGTGIRDVYADAAADHAEVLRLGGQVLHAALGALAARVKTEGEGIPLLVFNPLPWTRRADVAQADVLAPGPLAALGVFDDAGAEVPSQVVAPLVPGPLRVAFLAGDVPAAGYRLYWVRSAGAAKKTFPPVDASEAGKIESGRWLLEFDPASGALRRLRDKLREKDVVEPEAPGNLLQLFGDRGIESSRLITYTGERWDADRGAKIKVIEKGPVRAVVRIVRTFRDARPECSLGQESRFQQDVILYAGLDRIDIVHELDWYERYKILKLAFPVSVRAAGAAAGIPYGAVTRPASGDDFPAVGWFDLSDARYGVAVLNDGRAGYDVKDSLLRVHLARGSFDVDPEPDKGRHRFTVALLPHAEDWRRAGVPRRAAELNQPLIVCATHPHPGSLPPSDSFLAVEPENVMVGAVKRAEDSDALMIVRIAEAHGETGTVARLKLRRAPKKVAETDLLEGEIKGSASLRDGAIEVPLGPFEIKTIRIAMTPDMK